VDEPVEYDPRYLAGIVLFNDREFFEAHEVWEDLWGDCGDESRRFYQSLIQAAVALYHYGNGNLKGAEKLYRTSKAYMDAYPSPYRGLDAKDFWQRMAICFAPVHAEKDLNRRDLRPDPALIPTIALNPPPNEWPDPKQFLEDEV
jgi:hypothetical protein